MSKAKTVSGSVGEPVSGSAGARPTGKVSREVAKPAKKKCSYCKRGFPLNRDGFHLPTQALGMIPATRCELLPPAPPQPPTFRELVEESRPFVIEGLQLGGDFEQCNEAVATSQDWTHVLVEKLAGAMEWTRFDESDPHVNKMIRVYLAGIVATCEAWDAQLNAEDAS